MGGRLQGLVHGLDTIIEWVTWVWQEAGNPDSQDRIAAISAAVITTLALLAAAVATIKFALALIFKLVGGQGELIVTLTLADFDAKLDEREADVSSKMSEDQAKEHARLHHKISELELEKADSDKALKDAHAHIRSIQSRPEGEQ